MSGMEPWTQLWKQRELHHEISYHNLRTQESNCSIFVRACFGWSHLALFVLSLLYLCTVIFYLAMQGMQEASNTVSASWGEWLMITTMLALTYTSFGLVTFCATARCCDHFVSRHRRLLSPQSSQTDIGQV
eukprot:TRINITY_DN11747_c0_g1_i2.p3 TRINITY_DN11747_c0_g1~~TRINITY_DN11747_c0_g1_i2.p3  ORF type:complete len:131 (+),score=2.59 TRINITY_DN11747_c0_g1_i2:338-730(+)